VATGALLATGGPVLLAVLPLMLFMLVGKYRHLLLRKKMSTSLLQPSSQNLVLQAMANAVFSALKERKLLPEDTNQESITITLRSDRSFRVFLDHVEPRHAEIFVRSFQELLAPLTNQPYVIPKYEYDQGELTDRDAFLDVYMSGQAKPEIGSYHPVPKLLARSEKGRDAFERAWNQYVSPGFILATEQNPEVLQKYFGMGPSLSEKLLWE